jgi:hypothetical protein
LMEVNCGPANGRIRADAPRNAADNRTFRLPDRHRSTGQLMNIKLELFD